MLHWITKPIGAFFMTASKFVGEYIIKIYDRNYKLKREHNYYNYITSEGYARLLFPALYQQTSGAISGPIIAGPYIEAPMPVIRFEIPMEIDGGYPPVEIGGFNPVIPGGTRPFTTPIYQPFMTDILLVQNKTSNHEGITTSKQFSVTAKPSHTENINISEPLTLSETYKLTDISSDSYQINGVAGMHMDYNNSTQTIVSYTKLPKTITKGPDDIIEVTYVISYTHQWPNNLPAQNIEIGDTSYEVTFETIAPYAYDTTIHSLIASLYQHPIDIQGVLTNPGYKIEDNKIIFKFQNGASGSNPPEYQDLRQYNSTYNMIVAPQFIDYSSVEGKTVLFPGFTYEFELPASFNKERFEAYLESMKPAPVTNNLIYSPGADSYGGHGPIMEIPVYGEAF